MPFCKVFGIRMAATTQDKAVDTVCKRSDEWRGQYITFVNAHAISMTQNEAYFQAQRGAIVNFPDGYPIALYERKNGYPKAERIAGPDFMAAVFERSQEKGYRHYFYGSSEEVLRPLCGNLKKKYPGLLIAGACAPPKAESFSEAEMRRDIAKINAAAPDFIWIGLGAPKQEYWMQRAKERVTGLMLGVGAGFDFHAGTRRRAPEWMQRVGMEWIYRLLQEPVRLFPRYWTANTGFLKMWIKEKVTGWKR